MDSLFVSVVLFINIFISNDISPVDNYEVSQTHTTPLHLHSARVDNTNAVMATSPSLPYIPPLNKKRICMHGKQDLVYPYTKTFN